MTSGCGSGGWAEQDVWAGGRDRAGSLRNYPSVSK